MILPIVLYGDPVLRKVCKPVDQLNSDIKKLVENMFETMNTAKGVGLAAPQVGVPIRIFIIDPSQYEDEQNPDGKDLLKSFKRVFINPVLSEEHSRETVFNEGCLSLPGIREDVKRKSTITVSYCDENFVQKTESFEGLPARIILHEYDHIQGILFTDRINPLRKRLLQRKLNEISKGITDVHYKIKLPAKTKKITV
ncbi:MAG: peptide deformylase [Bacteroidetes bacterium]|nr:peptide deformylase [Bacteroidota bacterium]